jgi:hypothetical protein
MDGCAREGRRKAGAGKEGWRAVQGRGQRRKAGEEVPRNGKEGWEGGEKRKAEEATQVKKGWRCGGG